MNRRKLLCSLSAGGLSLIAGCYGSSDSEGATSKVSVDEPKLDGLNEDWKLLESRETQKLGEVEFSGFGVTSWYGRTKVWENLPLKKRLNELTLGNFDAEAFVFFATRIHFEGIGKHLTPTMVDEKVVKQVEAEMRGMDVSNVRKTGDGSMQFNGNSAKELRFAGSYVEKDIPFEVELPEKGKKTYRFERIEVPVNAVTALWKRNDEMILAGGAFPSPRGGVVDSGKRLSVTGGKRNGIDVTIELNLRFSPSEYREQAKQLILFTH